MINYTIPFNKPYLTGEELSYIKKAVLSGKISGNGQYTALCQKYFETRYGFNKCLLTTSCTDALEMCALLLDIKPGDEVIMPSYTFVSTANAFVLRGAKIVFVDSRLDHPGMDESGVEALITENTKAIVVVHYAGVACDMDLIMELAEKYKLWVVEDAAQAIDSLYKGKPLGSIGHLGAFSFHETKNIQCGEGGMLVINDERFKKRSEIIWEKGTNRSAFFRGEVDKYSWVDLGSSFLPSDINAAFLFAQLEHLDNIQSNRKIIWEIYYKYLLPLQKIGLIRLPIIPVFGTNNAHMFYLIFKNIEERQAIIDIFKQRGVLAVFHYISLHGSNYYKDKYTGAELKMSDFYSETLVRLPLYFELEHEEIFKIVTVIYEYYNVKMARQ